MRMQTDNRPALISLISLKETLKAVAWASDIGTKRSFKIEVLTNVMVGDYGA